MSESNQAMTDNNQSIGEDWFWSVIKARKAHYVSAGVASVVTNVCGLAASMFSMIVYNKIIPSAAIDTLIVLLGGVFIVLLTDFGTRFLRTKIINTTGKEIDEELSNQIIESLYKIQYAEGKRGIGAVANTIKDFEQVRDFFTSATLVTLFDLPFALFFIFVIWFVGGWMVIPVLIGAAILIGAALASNQLYKASSEAENKTAEQKNTVLVETLLGLEHLKTHNAGSLIKRRWTDAVSSYGAYNLLSKQRSLNLSNLGQIMAQVMQVAVVSIGVFLVVNEGLGFGAIIACTILIGKVVSPLSQFVQMMGRLNQVRVSFKAVDQLMKLPREPDSSQFIARDNLGGNIQLKDVSFAYPGTEKPIFEDFSLEILEGETVALLGPNGSGKTTLMRLLVGLYDNNAGEIYFGDVDARQISPEQRRHHLASVSQENWIISGTIRENIEFGLGGVEDADLVWASERSGLIDTINALPEGFNSVVGERGDGLSGGQKQQLAVARALVRRPSVLLVDEPSSSLDEKSENRLVKTLREDFADATVLLISHRPALLSLAQRVVIIDKGKIMRDEKLRAVRTVPKPEEAPEMNTQANLNINFK